MTHSIRTVLRLTLITFVFQITSSISLGCNWGRPHALYLYRAELDFQRIQGRKETTPLKLETEIRREIIQTEVHTYSVLLKSGQHYRMVIDQADVELLVTLTKPNRRTESYKVIGATEFGSKQIMLSPELTGIYQFEVRSLEGSSKGNYTLKIEQVKGANLTNIKQDNGFRRDEEAQAQRQKKLVRVEISEIDTQIREEIAKPVDEQSNQPGEATSRSLYEKYKAATERYNAIRDPGEEDAKSYVSLSGTNRTLLKLIQQDLSEDTALLSYFLDSNRAVAFIINNRTIIKRELPTNSKEISSAFNDLLSFADLSEAPLQTLEQLYSGLISPVEVDLEAANLGIIGDGPLHYLPFAALTSNGKQYLSERFNLFYLPKLEIMLSIRGTKRQKYIRQLLVIAPKGVKGLSFLKNSKTEVANINKLYKIKRLTGPNATKMKFLAAADKHQIVHVIAHAQCNEQTPKLSRIVMTPGADKDVSLSVEDVLGLKLRHINLVVLSACETKVCGEYRADEITTLNDAFIAAGAPTVIASLWTVDDQATSLFMSSFYKHLKRMSKAAALSAAQNEMRTEYPHPYYWAAFVLTGDPGVTDRQKPRNR